MFCNLFLQLGFSLQIIFQKIFAVLNFFFELKREIDSRASGSAPSIAKALRAEGG